MPDELREFLAAATDTKLTVQECLCATEQELAQFLFPNDPRVRWRGRSALEWIVPLLREKERARHAQSIVRICSGSLSAASQQQARSTG